MDENHTDTARKNRRGVWSSIVGRGLGRTLIAWFLLLALVPLALISGISYLRAKSNLQDSAIRSLEATAALKTDFINNWFHYRFLDLEVQATSLKNAQFLAELRQAFKASGKEVGEFTKSHARTAIVAERDADLKTFRKTYGYHDVFLIDSDGNILFSVAGESDLGTNLFSGEHSGTRFSGACRKALETGRPAFSDLEFYATTSDTEVTGFLAAAIVDDAGDKIGLLVLQLPLDAINTIMHKRTGLGKTGETHLIGSDKMLRSDCAFNPESTTLKKQVDTEQARIWFEEHGDEKAQDLDDMRERVFSYPGPHDGRTVLGVHENMDIAGVHWAMIAEIEDSEVSAPVRRLGALTLALLGLTAIVVLLLSVSVARRIVRPLLTLSGMTRSVAEGQYDQEISVNVRNEIGDLATNFREMLVALRDAKSTTEAEDWLKTGQAGVGDAMRGEQDLPTLGRNVVTFLAKYLDARIGAFYAVSDGAVLRLVGSYAYTVRKGLSNEYRVGEGLVGQAALEKETIVLTDVPDDYIKVQSGVGAAGPTSIVVMPVLDNGEVKAVVELGAFGDLGERELRLLALVAENIGVAISTAQSRVRVNDLLEETQAQSEELQAREEELRESNDELKKQARELKESEAQLQTQQEELRQTNEELEEQQERIERQNVELQEAQCALEERAKELELTSRYKSEFLANMSHELRTPLNSLLILSQLLQTNKEGNLTEKQVESARTIHSGGEELLRLINDILDLSKVEAGMIEFVIESVNIRDLAGGVERQFKNISGQRGIDFGVEVDEGLPATLRTDHQRVSQVLKNLLSNAFKFAEQGRVALRVSRPRSGVTFSRPELDAASTVAFSVSDTGVGIPEDKQAMIFEAFKQADGGTSRKFGGTGLGLSISRQFAEALGGEMQVKSQEGKGSEFTLFLPESPPVDIPDKSEDTAGRATSAGAARKPSVAPVLAAAPAGKPSGPRELDTVRDDRREIQPEDKSLLIIEDDAGFAKVLADLAHEKGFKCVIAGEGETGLQHADYYKPSAIILDIGLPGMDGWAVMNRLKENPDTRHIPVHFMSAMDEPRDAFGMGAVGYLMKPLNVEQLDQAFSTIEDNVGKPVKELLIVAGDEVTGREIVETVGNGDVKSVVVTSGKEAHALLREGRFDCIVIHPVLTDMTGTDLLGKIEDDREINRIPIVVYSGEELSAADEAAIARHVGKMIVHTVRSPERLLDETTLFLHRVEADLPETQRKMLKMVHDKESILNGKKILLADDDMRNVFALSAALEDKGLEIVVAKNGKEALAQLDDHPDIDLVLMDIMMPVMDGYETTAEIRLRKPFERLPIIALTAKAMKGDRQKCIEFGASDYLSKPVDLEKLTSLLRVWLYR